MYVWTKKFLPLFLFACVCVAAIQPPALAAENGKASQTVLRVGTYDSAVGPAQYFTGTVRVDNLFPAQAPAKFIGAYVTFEPGARSNWHTHTVGQTLVIVSGVGLTQQWGGPVVEVRPGDVIQCPTGVKHWHGAAPGTAMTHLSICEELNGEVVTWMEKVTDAQYNGKRA